MPSVFGKYAYLPFLHGFRFTSSVGDRLCTYVEQLPFFQHGYVYQRRSLFTGILNLYWQTTSDNFERVNSFRLLII